MVRAPCCEKMGLKKGPWTSEEDMILINYINLNGHSNWRALPKLAGLSRCGKSCRLRWINYLRPDLKRGNFCREEEDAIIKLHDSLGNRWSAIAAKFPGRTDNEIKNVWHTHLKKRVTSNHNQKTIEKKEEEYMMTDKTEPADCEWNINNILPEADESFWSEVLSGYSNSGDTTTTVDSPQISSTTSSGDISSSVGSDFFPELDMSYWPAYNNNQINDQDYSFSCTDDDMLFWYNVFTTPDQELPENI